MHQRALIPESSLQTGIVGDVRPKRLLATHFYDAGVPLRQIMAIIGHASLASLTSCWNLEQRTTGDVVLGFFAGEMSRGHRSR
jgi:site-specific recombinase XerD